MTTLPSLKNQRGFTLAELLVALAVLGFIAAFTIPKVITSQGSTGKNSVAMEVISSISQAYQQYCQVNTCSANSIFTSESLIPYFNYSQLIVDGTKIDHYPAWGVGAFLSCDNTCFINCGSCIRLHNGAMLQFSRSTSFNSHGFIGFSLDVDGQYQNDVANTSGKSAEFGILPNGRVSYRQVPSWFKRVAN